MDVMDYIILIIVFTIGLSSGGYLLLKLALFLESRLAQKRLAFNAKNYTPPPKRTYEIEPEKEYTRESPPPSWVSALAEKTNLEINTGLEFWVHSVAETAFKEYGGSLAAKRIYAHFRSVQSVPGAWRSLHFFEALASVLMASGYAEMKSRRAGIKLTEAGIVEFEADPGRWYP